MLLRDVGDLALEVLELVGGLLLLLLSLLSSGIGASASAILVVEMGVLLLRLVGSVDDVLGVTLSLVDGVVLGIDCLVLSLLGLALLLGEASVGNRLVVATNLAVRSNPL